MVKGVVLVLLSSLLFGLLYFYPVLLSMSDSTLVFCWRIIFSLPAIAFLITVEKNWSDVGIILMRAKKSPLFILGLLTTASLLSIEMLLFIWVPLNGRALSTSLGYFILPLAIAITGRIFYKETLSFLQKMAVLAASLGVIAEIYQTGAFSWDTALVFIGYPAYFVIRKTLKTDKLAGFLLDLFVIMIGCVIFLASKMSNPFAIYAQSPKLMILLPLLGVITAAAFATYLAASRLLPLGLFGLLGYAEPFFFLIIAMVFLTTRFYPMD